MTIFLHYEAVFLCLTRDGTTHWRVNDTDLPSELYPDLVTVSTSLSGLDIFSLTVPGRAEYNASRVQCVTEDGSDSVESLIATLKIQGVYICTYSCSLGHGQGSIYLRIQPLLLITRSGL